VRCFRLPASTIGLLFMLLASLPVHAQESDLKSLAGELARAINKTSKHPSAVVDFTDLQGNVTLAGKFYAEELETALENSEVGIDLVDRTRLQLILQENKLASKEGLIDPATARKLGNIAGVQVLITGTITPLDNTIRLSLKALDTENARVLAAVSANVNMTPAIARLLNQQASSSAPLGQATSTQSAPSSQGATTGVTGQIGPFKVQIDGCRKEGYWLRCSGSLLNQDTARKRILFNDYFSYMVDNLGNQSQMNQFARLKYQLGSDGDSAELEPNLPMKMLLSSYGLSDQATSVSLVMKLGEPSGTLTLRDVPISSK